MPREPRIQYPGAIYHVYNRGVEKRIIFNRDEDYEKFIEILNRVQIRFVFELYAFCLIPNHYHLLLKTPNGNISKIMQCLILQYTQYFNKQYSRVGPLFQGRYKDRIVETEEYLNRLAEYIYFNPVKDGLVKNPEDYRWSNTKVSDTL